MHLGQAMATTVEITAGDDGKLTVGIVDAPSADAEDSKQVDNIAQALAMAKHLLMSASSGTDDTASGGDDMQAGAADASAAPGAADPSQAGDDGASDPSQGDASTTGAPGAASQPDAKAMWDQLAASNGPAH